MGRCRLAQRRFTYLRSSLATPWKLPLVMTRSPLLLAMSSVCSLVLQFAALSAHAIALGQVDDFEGGTTMGWHGNQAFHVPDIGPLGVGDDALRVDSFQRMVVRSDFVPFVTPAVPTQWTCDYLAAGVTYITMDVRNPNEFDMQLFLGVADDTLSTAGAGASYITDYFFLIPADDVWHTVEFSIAPDDFVPSAGNTEAPPAGAAPVLSNVYQLRIFHSTFPGEFRGDETIGHFLLDNITASGPVVAEDADFDGDDDVDGADFLTWQQGLGVGTTLAAGDANASGSVTAADLAIWQAQFGTTSAVSPAAAIPEPGGYALIGLTLAFCPFAIRHRRLLLT
jgi:hypothetical protein